MKKVLLPLLLFTLISCSSPEPKGATVPESKKVKAEFFISEHEKQFKHKNIRVFPMDSIDDLNSTRPIEELHTPIINDLHLQVFQDENNIDTCSTEGTMVLYSIQKRKGHQGILIAGMDDAWVDNIYYRSYDLKGKFIDETVLYQKGGDGGYYTQSFGRFINDTTYFRTHIESELDMEDPTKTVGDTSRAIIIIHSNGKIEEHEEK